MSCFHFDMAHSKKSPSQDSRDAQDAAKDLDGKKIAGKEVHHRKRCTVTWLEKPRDGNSLFGLEIWKWYPPSGVGSARQCSQENDQHQCCCCAVLTQMWVGKTVVKKPECIFTTQCKRARQGWNVAHLINHQFSDMVVFIFYLDVCQCMPALAINHLPFVQHQCFSSKMSKTIRRNSKSLGEKKLVVKKHVPYFTCMILGV